MWDTYDTVSRIVLQIFEVESQLEWFREGEDFEGRGEFANEASASTPAARSPFSPPSRPKGQCKCKAGNVGHRVIRLDGRNVCLRLWALRLFLGCRPRLMLYLRRNAATLL